MKMSSWMPQDAGGGLATKHMPTMLILMLMLGLGLMLPSMDGTAVNVLVPQEALPHLLVGGDELPYDMILNTLHEPLPATYRALWYGPPKAHPGALLKTTDCVVMMKTRIATSPQSAVQAAQDTLREYSISPSERTGEQEFDSFADRAWYLREKSGGSLLFVRANVVIWVCVANKDGFEEDHLFALAKRLSNKVQAAMEGRPYPIPYLPPSVNDMKMELEDAWKLKNAGELFGNKSTTIALQNGKAQPKSLPAKQLGEKDYLVTLSHVAGILGMKEKPKVGDDTASFKIAGKQVTVTRGKSEVKVDKQSVQLSRPAEFMGGQVLVPLSFVEKAFGQPLVWEKKDKVQVARLKTKVGEG